MITSIPALETVSLQLGAGHASNASACQLAHLAYLPAKLPPAGGSPALAIRGKLVAAAFLSKEKVEIELTSHTTKSSVLLASLL